MENIIPNKPIISIKTIIIIVSVICVFTLLTSYFIIKTYLHEFNGEFSKVQSEWGDFGSFVSGTIGTLFNLLAVIFSLLSIYITLKIAIRIHENETIINQNISNREKEKFDREIELTEKQNKPFPVIDYNNIIEKSDIILLNQGPGTLIVTKLEILHNHKTYNNFVELIHEKISQDKDYSKITLIYNPAPSHIIIPGGSKRLFEINRKDNEDKVFERYRDECQLILDSVKIKLQYEDIFENKFEIEASISA